MMKNFLITLTFIPLVFFCSAQDRITSIPSSQIIEKTHITQYKGETYLISVTPNDVIEVFKLQSDQSLDLIRTKHLPFSYDTRRSNLLVKEKYFIIVTPAKIFNYDFIEDKESYSDVNDYLPPNYGFNVRFKDQESVSFGLNANSYVYYYKENRLLKLQGYVHNKYNDHLLMTDAVSNPAVEHLYYSKNAGQDKQLLISKSTTKNGALTTMYENFLLAADSTGQVIRYDYESGDIDSLFTFDIEDAYLISFAKLDEFYVSVNSNSRDSGTVVLYDPVTIQPLESFKIVNSAYVHPKNIKVVAGNVILLDSRRVLTVFNPQTKAVFRMRNVNIFYDETLYTIDNKILYYSYQYPFNTLGLLNVNTFQQQALIQDENQIISYSFGNALVKNGTKYYYNAEVDYINSPTNLFQIDLNLKTAKPLNLASFYAGVPKNDPLVLNESGVQLLSDNIYQIGDTYTKVNQFPLTKLTNIPIRTWKLFDQKTIFAADSSGHRLIYYDNGNKHFNLNQYIGNVGLYDIFFVNDYCIIIQDNREMYMISLSEKKKTLVDNNLTNFPDYDSFFALNNHFYYIKSAKLYAYNLVSGLKTLIKSGVSNVSHHKNIKGKNIILIDSGLYTIDENNNMSIIANPFPYLTLYDSFEDNLSNLYMNVRSEESHFTLKYDGSVINKLLEGYQISSYNIQSKKSKYIILNVLDSVTYKYTSRVLNSETDQVYVPQTKNNVQLQQVTKFKDTSIGIFGAQDTTYVVTYNDDFSDYSVLKSIYEPQQSNYTELVGDINKDRLLLASSNSYLYMDERLNIYRFNDIIPNQSYTSLIAKDSVFYFMAIGKPLGNQVYAFNHERFSRSNINHTLEVAREFPWHIYPNPGIDIIKAQFLESTSEPQIFGAEVYSLDGRLQTNCLWDGHHQIYIGDLTAGTYILRLVLDGGVSYTRKIVKQ